MKISELEKINASIEIYRAYEERINKLNVIMSKQEKTGNVFFCTEFHLSLDPVITTKLSARCGDVDILTPLMEYYKKELEKIKQELKKYGVEFDD